MILTHPNGPNCNCGKTQLRIFSVNDPDLNDLNIKLNDLSTARSDKNMNMIGESLCVCEQIHVVAIHFSNKVPVFQLLKQANKDV